MYMQYSPPPYSITLTWLRMPYHYTFWTLNTVMPAVTVPVLTYLLSHKPSLPNESLFNFINYHNCSCSLGWSCQVLCLYWKLSWASCVENLLTSMKNTFSLVYFISWKSKTVGYLVVRTVFRAVFTYTISTVFILFVFPFNSYSLLCMFICMYLTYLKLHTLYMLQSVSVSTVFTRIFITQ